MTCTLEPSTGHSARSARRHHLQSSGQIYRRLIVKIVEVVVVVVKLAKYCAHLSQISLQAADDRDGVVVVFNPENKKV